jgi:pentatricopeptide repeat protein
VVLFNHLVPALPADSLPELYAAVIDLRAKHHHFLQAHHLLDETQEWAVPISSQLIITLIRWYVRAGMSEEASELFHQMEEYGAGAPEPAKLASLLRVLAKKRLASEV